MATDFSCGVIPYRLGPQGRVEFLVVQHRGGKHWGFPKGHPERDESDLQAARRELAEEAGLTDVQLMPQPAFEERYVFTAKGGVRISKTVRYFLGQVRSGEATRQEEEVAALAWGDEDATRSRLTFDEGRELLAKAAATLRQPGFAKQ
ncbi:MAG: NUDIX domain-containing protein [Planctomycetota bacterium]